MTPLDWSCGTCTAQIGEPCYEKDKWGNQYLLVLYHAARIEANDAMTSNADPATSEQLDKAAASILFGE